jgi:MoxR-like ATPase
MNVSLNPLRFLCDLLDLCEADLLDFLESLEALDRLLLFDLWCNEPDDTEEEERLLFKNESKSKLESNPEVDEFVSFLSDLLIRL